MGLLAGIIADSSCSATAIFSAISWPAWSARSSAAIWPAFNIKLNLGNIFIEQMIISVVGAIIVLASCAIF